MDNIRFLSEDRKIYNKRAIAKAIDNSTNNDELVCGFLDNGIIESCDKCEVKDICAGLDKLIDEHKKKTTKVVTTFNF